MSTRLKPFDSRTHSSSDVASPEQLDLKAPQEPKPTGSQAALLAEIQQYLASIQEPLAQPAPGSDFDRTLQNLVGAAPGAEVMTEFQQFLARIQDFQTSSAPSSKEEEKIPPSPPSPRAAHAFIPAQRRAQTPPPPNVPETLPPTLRRSRSF